MDNIHDLYRVVEDSMIYSEWAKELDVGSQLKELKEEISELETGDLTEEIGDVLYDTLVLLKIISENTGIKESEIINNTIEKMRRRKPHVFEKRFLTKEEESKHWYETKKNENN